jgi:acetylornithine deacetylase/succinyl-diaminopimelate desuccinylase-like protein
VYRRLRGDIERFGGDVIRFTQDLIRLPSPSLHEKEVARKVDHVMRELCYDLVFTDDVGNIVGVIVGGDPGYTILMCSHMDTVKPEGLDGWHRSPFSGDIVQGRIEGVGAADCKGALASQVYAGRVLASSRLAPKGNIVVAATVADEGGYGVGIRNLLGTTLPELEMAPRVVVLGEPTDLAIGTGHEGWVGIDVDAFSPVEKRAWRAGRRVVESLSNGQGDSGSPESQAIMKVDQPRAGPTDRGFKVTVRLYRRLEQDDSADDVLGWFEGSALEGARKVPAVALEVHVHAEEQRLYTGHTRSVRLSVPPWSTDLVHPLIDRARDSMLAAGCGWRPEFCRSGCVGLGTAGAVATTEFAIPAIGFGPGEERQAHACNESVSLSSLVDAAFGAAVLMHGLSTASRRPPVGTTGADRHPGVARASHENGG